MIDLDPYIQIKHRTSHKYKTGMDLYVARTKTELDNDSVSPEQITTTRHFNKYKLSYGSLRVWSSTIVFPVRSLCYGLVESL